MPSQREVEQLCTDWIGLAPYVVRTHILPSLPSRHVAKLGGADELISVGRFALFEAARRFEPTRLSGRTGQPVKFQTFAVVSMKRFLWRWISTQPTSGAEDFAFESLPSREPDAQHYAEVNELARVALADLKPRQREVMTLRYLEGKKPAETAAVMGISRECVRQIEANAITAARGRLETKKAGQRRQNATPAKSTRINVQILAA